MSKRYGTSSDTDAQPYFRLGVADAQFNREIRHLVVPETEIIPSGVMNARAEEAWDCGQGKGVRVAVLDTGIDKNHQDLLANFGGESCFIDNEGTEDQNGHGTAMAGLISAARNGVGIIGVAPSCTFFNVKVLDKYGSGSVKSVVSALEWCITQSIQIIVMPFGIERDDKKLFDSCSAAVTAGLILISSPDGFPGKYPFVISATHYPLGSDDKEAELCVDGSNTLTTFPNQQYGKISPKTAAIAVITGSIALALGTHRFSNNNEIRRQMTYTAAAIVGSKMRKINALNASMGFSTPS